MAKAKAAEATKEAKITPKEVVEKLGKPEKSGRRLDLDKVDELIESDKITKESTPEEVKSAVTESGAISPVTPESILPPGPPPTNTKEVAAPSQNLAKAFEQAASSAPKPIVKFPEFRQPHPTTPRASSVAEIKAAILDSATASQQDLNFLLMQKYNMLDKGSSKMLRVALSELVSEGKIAVDNSGYAQLGVHHYNNGPETGFYSLKDIKINVRKL